MPNLCLCDREDMIRHFSYRGIVSFSDHDQCGEEDVEVLDDCIERASDELEGYLYPLYRSESLPLSRTVRHWATVVACFFLCEKRGNPVPDSLYDEYMRIMQIPGGLVDRTRRGIFVLPCIPRTNVNVPSFSNLTVDRRYRREKIRVIEANSSPIKSKIEQDTAPEFFTS